MLNKISLFIEAHIQSIKSENKRMVVAFHSDEKWGDLDEFINQLTHSKKCIISSTLKNSLPAELAATKLGEEYDLVVFDMRESFSPDALGVVAGVLCGGGCLVVILPDVFLWRNSDSLFKNHFENNLVNYPSVFYIKNKEDISNANKYYKGVVADNNLKSSDKIFPYVTFDQKSAVELIVKSIQAEGEFCCVLTSGRGRGKSSSLGFVASQLIKYSACNLLVSAPKLSVSNPVFSRLKKQCPQGELSRGAFKLNESTLSFIAPDLLLETLPKADVLFIDEAAVIPVSMLQKLLAHYPKIIFSTTTHGYEGTGRGFVLKFYKLLDRVNPGWQKIQLHQPVRWAENDPLEAWAESVLFLNLSLSVKPELPNELSSCQLVLVNRSQLIQDAEKMASIFALLVFAHYRTSPSDFQYLLDDPNVRIYSLEFKHKCLAVLVVNQEGGFDAELSRAIYRGERRPKGHLLAQTLCFHGGAETAAEFNYARVMRIAVHPDIQQKGFGSFLLKQVIKTEIGRGIDIFGCSFSATPNLMGFWSRAGLSLLRLGFSRDHVSASHSAVMAVALTNGDAGKMIDALKLKFSLNIPLWLQGPLSGVSDDIKSHGLLHDIVQASDVVFEFDLEDVESFAKYNRNYDACMPAINRFIVDKYLSHKAWVDLISEQDQTILKLSLQYRNDWKMIVSEMRAVKTIQGRSQAIKLLRVALSNLLELK